MSSFFTSDEKNPDRAALVLRLVLGSAFIAHGYQKIFGFGIPNVATMFAHMSVPISPITAPFISVLELVGGLAIFLGVLTRIAAVLVACDMLGAMIIVHGKAGYFAPKGIELVFSYFGMAVAIALIGAGAYSIDALWARRAAPTPRWSIFPACAPWS